MLVKNLNEFQSFSQLVHTNKSLHLQTVVLELKKTSSNVIIRKALKLKNEEEVFILKRLRIVNTIPVAIETSYLRSIFFPRVESIDFSNHALYESIQKQYGVNVNFTNEEILIVKATLFDSKQLHIPFGSNLVLIKGVSYDDKNHAIEYFESVNLPELYEFKS